MTVRVVGLDPSLNATGLTLPDGTSRTIHPDAGPKDPARRLHQVITRIDGYLKASRPDVAVVETVFVGALSRQTALALGALAGCVRLRLFDLDIPFCDVAPAQLKQWATGDGRASKEQMIEAARRSGATVVDDNQADAWWLYAMGRMRYSETWSPGYRCVDLLAVRDRVSRSLRWPTLEVPA